MLEVTWLGHSTFEMRLDGGEVLVTDPWVEGNPKYPQGHKFEKIDTMIISHGHFDHFNDVVPLAKKFEPKIAAIFEVTKFLEEKGVKGAAAMNKGGTAPLGSIKVTMTEAIHSSCFVDGSKLSCAGEPVGFILHLQDGRRVYFAGDTAVFSDMALLQQIYRPEIVFLPIGDLFTMGPEQAAVAVGLLKPKIVVPMHYGTFPALTGTPEELKRLLSEAGSSAEVRVLNIGERTPL